MAITSKNIAIVCNPTRENEKSLRIANRIMILLGERNIRNKLHVEMWPDSWEDATEVWIVGGDGTINWFINRYPGISLPLAVFAGGSGNDFYWMLYGDRDTDEQVAFVLDADVRRVDAGICNDRLFLNGVGIGFDGAIVKDLLGKKKLAGKASYLLSILKHIIGYAEKPCTLKLPGETIEQDCMLVSVANARRYGGGFHVAPRASVTDALLDVNIVGKISPFNRMRYLPVMERGEHLALSFVQYRQTGEVFIHAPGKLHTHIDGEYFFESSFRIRVLPEHFSFFY